MPTCKCFYENFIKNIFGILKAAHQSGHNSGVVHAGIYYKPGTLKARLCVEGLHLSYKYFEEKGVPYKKCGKLVVAVEKHELPRLDDLHDRAIQNGVPDLQMIEGSKIKEIEPYCQVNQSQKIFDHFQFHEGI